MDHRKAESVAIKSLVRHHPFLGRKHNFLGYHHIIPISRCESELQGPAFAIDQSSELGIQPALGSSHLLNREFDYRCEPIQYTAELISAEGARFSAPVKEIHRSSTYEFGGLEYYSLCTWTNLPEGGYVLTITSNNGELRIPGFVTLARDDHLSDRMSAAGTLKSVTPWAMGTGIALMLIGQFSAGLRKN